MWDHGRLGRAFGAAGVICWLTPSEALCSATYGSSVGASNAFAGNKSDSNDLFTCMEGTFMRSVVISTIDGDVNNVIGIQYECSDGELSDLYGAESLNLYVASCPDPEGFGIGSISMSYTDGFHRAEVRCAGEQACQGYVCEEDENGEVGTDCTLGGKADYCGPMGWDPDVTYSSNDTLCEEPDENYIVGFRTLWLSTDSSLSYVTARCSSIEGCPLDRPDAFWDIGIHVARAIFGGATAIIFVISAGWVLWQKHSGSKKKQRIETYTASLAGAFTALGGTLAEALAGSNAAAVGFAATCAFALLVVYYCHPDTPIESPVPAQPSSNAPTPAIYAKEAELVRQGNIA